MNKFAVLTLDEFKSIYTTALIAPPKGTSLNTPLVTPSDTLDWVA